MRRAFYWTFTIIGLIFLWQGGASIFSEPDTEVLYSAEPPLRSCVSSGCIFIYNLTIGNTGREPQSNVRVRLHSALVEQAILKPSIRNFGVVDRPVDLRNEGSERIYDLGLLRPQQRVEMRFTLKGNDARDAPSWHEMLVAVEPAQGAAVSGNPAGVALARMIWAIFGVRW